jgi:hypothetical protein
MGVAAIEVNVVLMLPEPASDPAARRRRNRASLLPHRMAWQYSRLEPWGFPISCCCSLSGYLSVILEPMVRASFGVSQRVSSL